MAALKSITAQNLVWLEGQLKRSITRAMKGIIWRVGALLNVILIEINASRETPLLRSQTGDRNEWC